MSWNIEIKETGKETKYKIWSTIVDEYITDKWMTREEIINFFFWHYFRNFADKFLETAFTFPDGWYQKDGKLISKDSYKEFYKFQSKAIQDDKLFYETFFDELKKHGIKISVQDKDYNVHSH